MEEKEQIMQSIEEISSSLKNLENSISNFLFFRFIISTVLFIFFIFIVARNPDFFIKVFKFLMNIP